MNRWSPITALSIVIVLFSGSLGLDFSMPNATGGNGLRVAFVGDSQLRHLSYHFEEHLLANVDHWWPEFGTEWKRLCFRGAPIPRPKKPNVGFSFAWLTNFWPPVQFRADSRIEQCRELRSPISVAFLSIEYASRQRYVENFIDHFQPSVVILGRGCWDLIRRLPPAGPLETLFQQAQKELVGALQMLYERPFIKFVGVLPLLRIGSIRLHGAGSISYQRKRTPWTMCGADISQHHLFDHLARLVLNQHHQWRHSYRKLHLLDVESITNNETIFEEVAPVDGLHYEATVVINTLIAQIWNLISSDAHLVPNLRVTLPPFRLSTMCKQSQFRYRKTVLRKVVHVEVTRFRSKSRVESASDKFFSCAEFRARLWRYLGPPPWNDPDVSNAEMIRVRCEAFEMTFSQEKTNNTLEILFETALRKHISGDSGACKAVALTMLEYFSRSLGQTPQLWDTNCLNEPFGGRP